MKVLLIDDDVTFRSGLAALLIDDGHEVRELCSTSELPALSALSWVDAAVIGDDMTGQDGLMMADRLHAEYSGIVVVLTSPYSTHHLEAEVAQRPFLHLLRKPIIYDDLHAILRRRL